MKLLCSFVTALAMLFCSPAMADDLTNTLINAGVSMAAGAAGAAVVNSVSEKKPTGAAATVEKGYIVPGLSLLCNTDKTYERTCYVHDADSVSMIPSAYLRHKAGANARLVDVTYFKEFAIIRYQMVK
jgi:hypothetical protein